MKFCPICLNVVSVTRHSNAIYCSIECKRKAENARSKENYISLRKTKCVGCGDIIPDWKNFSTKYCSDNCRIFSSNERRQIVRDSKRKIPSLLPKNLFQIKYQSKVSSLKKNNWTIEEWVSLQNGKCAICHKSNYEQGLDRELAADHCHETEKRRALVCFKCNLLLGHANDDINILAAAVRYLSLF